MAPSVRGHQKGITFSPDFIIFLIYTSSLLRFFYMPFPGKVVPPLGLSLETVTCRQDDFAKSFHEPPWPCVWKQPLDLRTTFRKHKNHFVGLFACADTWQESAFRLSGVWAPAPSDLLLSPPCGQPSSTWNWTAHVWLRVFIGSVRICFVCVSLCFYFALPLQARLPMFIAVARNTKREPTNP